MSQLELLLSDADTPKPGWTIAPETIPLGAKWRIVRHGDQAIGFSLLRSRRRSIGFVIQDEGLRVTAPNWVTLGQIDAAVIEKMPWILAKLQDWQARKERLAMSHTRLQSGGELPYMGCKIILRSGTPDTHVTHGAHGAHGPAFFEGDPNAPEHGQQLWLALPNDADMHRIRDMTQAWLQTRAKILFGQRINHFLDKTGLTISRWRLSSAATRWGSCTSDGNIMLNWRLIHFSPMVIDYVIAHELAHLREMNHSQDFWSEVQQLYPDYQQAKKMLQKHTPDHVPDL
jgi:predicted metal-dependent hydrolase